MGTLCPAILLPQRAEGCARGGDRPPAAHRFEKLVGSLYLGETVRHAMLMLASEQALFIGRNTSTLATKAVLTTQQVLEIME